MFLVLLLSSFVCAQNVTNDQYEDWKYKTISEINRLIKHDSKSKHNFEQVVESIRKNSKLLTRTQLSIPDERVFTSDLPVYGVYRNDGQLEFMMSSDEMQLGGNALELLLELSNRTGLEIVEIKGELASIVQRDSPFGDYHFFVKDLATGEIHNFAPNYIKRIRFKVTSKEPIAAHLALTLDTEDKKISKGEGFFGLAMKGEDHLLALSQPSSINWTKTSEPSLHTTEKLRTSAHCSDSEQVSKCLKKPIETSLCAPVIGLNRCDRPVESHYLSNEWKLVSFKMPIANYSLDIAKSRYDEEKENLVATVIAKGERKVVLESFQVATKENPPIEVLFVDPTLKTAKFGSVVDWNSGDVCHSFIFLDENDKWKQKDFTCF